MDTSTGSGIQTGIGSRWEHQRRKDADQMSLFISAMTENISCIRVFHRSRHICILVPPDNE